MKKYMGLGLLALAFYLISATGALATSFDLSTGTDNSASLTYTSGGITLTLNNAVDTDGNAANFAVATGDGLVFSNREVSAPTYSGSDAIDTFDITFNKDVTITSFTRGSNSGVAMDSGMSFSISRGDDSSGTVDIAGTTDHTITFSQGDIDFFAANQAYTVDFTRGTGIRTLAIRSLDVSAYTAPAMENIEDTIVIPITPGVIPEPGTMTLLSLGLIGLAGYRRRETND